MHLLRDLHPTLLSALEGIVDQVSKGVYLVCWSVPVCPSYELNLSGVYKLSSGLVTYNEEVETAISDRICKKGPYPAFSNFVDF